MKTQTMLIAGGIGLVAIYLMTRKSGSVMGFIAPNSLSQKPGTQYPYTVPQAPRQDNNPAVNNQPWAKSIPQSSGGFFDGVNLGNIGQIAGSVKDTVSSIGDIWGSLFGGDDASDMANNLADYEPSKVDDSFADFMFA